MRGGPCFGGASDDTWSNQWRFAENPQQAHEQQQPHAQTQQQSPSQHQQQQQQMQQWRFEQQQQQQQRQQPPVHQQQHHPSTPEHQMPMQQQKQMRHQPGQQQQQQLRAQQKHSDQYQLQSPSYHGRQEEPQQEEPQQAWLDQSRRNRRGGGTRKRGSRRGLWTAPEAPSPEDGACLPTMPAWPAYSAVAANYVRGACALPETPTSFFVKVDVRDFYDNEDLNCDAPSCPGHFFAVWESDGDDEELEPLESVKSSSPADVAASRFPHGGKHNDHGDAHSGGSDHGSGGGCSGFDREEPEMRAKDIILQDIRGLLERCPVLQLADFDYRVRQHLHAMYGTGGRQQVIHGLESVRLAVHQKLRSSVRSWPGYILALLKKSEC